MCKVIKFLILATFFLSGDAFSQSKISNFNMMNITSGLMILEVLGIETHKK